MNTQAVMAHYRELGSTLEASYVVLWEFCGPTITYGRGLETLKPPKLVPTESVPTAGVPTCGCGRPCEGRYKQCSACRKRVYRGRRQ